MNNPNEKKLSRAIVPLQPRRNMTGEESRQELQKRIALLNEKREIRQREEGYDAPPPGWGMQKPIVNSFICPTCKKPVNKTDTHGFVSRVNPDTGRHTPVSCPTCTPPVQRYQARENKKFIMQRLVDNGTFTNLSNFPDGTEGWTLSTFKAQRNIDKSTGLYLESNFVKGKNKNILLHGETGRGKTGAAIGAARELIQEGYTAFFIRTSDYVDMIESDRKALRNNNIENVYQIEKICRGVEVAIFDELGAGPAWEMREMEAIIEYRWNVGLRTLITSNMGLEGLKAHYQQEKYDRTGFQPADRIISRLSRYITKQVGGIDQRKGN